MGKDPPPCGMRPPADRCLDPSVVSAKSSQKFNLVGFSSWASADTQEHFESPNYSFSYVSATAFNVFLAPLD